MGGVPSTGAGAVLRRLLVGAGLLAVFSVALFYLLHLMPGSPEELLLASNPDLRGRVSLHPGERCSPVRSPCSRVHRSS